MRADQHVDTALRALPAARAQVVHVAELLRPVDQQPPPQSQRHQQAAAAGRIEARRQVAVESHASARRRAA